MLKRQQSDVNETDPSGNNGYIWRKVEAVPHWFEGHIQYIPARNPWQTHARFFFLTFSVTRQEII